MTSRQLISSIRETESPSRKKDGTTDYFGDPLEVPGAASLSRRGDSSGSGSRPNYNSVDTDSNLGRAEGEDALDTIQEI